MKANTTPRKTILADEDAVSPVVATLLLVLVAAGAAIGFGVFLNGFQSSTQDNVSSDVSSQCLRIAGSSTVFEFTAVAEPLFENSQGGCDIINNAGGSGAGLQSIGIGAVDIGAMSHDPTTSDLSKYPDLNKDGKKDFGVPDLHITRVGYDAVVPVVKPGNCALSAGATEALTTDIYRDIWAYNGLATSPTQAGPIAPGADNLYSWEEVFPIACGGRADVIQLVSRSDKGGTVDVFCDKLVGNGDQNDLCKAPVGSGNLPGVWVKKAGATGDALLGNQDAEALLGGSLCPTPSATVGGCLGYTSMAGDDTNTAISGLKVDGIDDGDRADAVQATSTTVRDLTFVGYRSLVYLTIGEPSGVAKQYLDFVLLPKNNQEISVASGFVSLYP